MKKNNFNRGFKKHTFTNPPLDKTVLEIIRQEDISVVSYCGGIGTCGKCRVHLEGELSPITESERSILDESELSSGIRLACKTFPTGDFTAYIRERSDMKIQTSGKSTIFSPSPLGGKSNKFGIAIDIGTTTVAVYLCDVTSGNIIRTAAFCNPQASYGADVISRIAYITENNALNLLRDALLNEIKRAVEGFGLKHGEIGAAVICGNTIMQHIALELDPAGMATAPFKPISFFGEMLTAGEAGFDFLPFDVPVYIPPCYSAYVGGDIAAGLVASGIYDGYGETNGLELYIDIGTNGEIALVGNGLISFCSAAAGPAFEGAKIECGMPGTVGAVNKVRSLSGESGIDFDVIDGGEPLGICGSGLLDLTALLLDSGVIDESGYMAKNFPLKKSNNVYLTPRDVRELQLAKSAIAAGIMTLLHERKAVPKDVTRVILAGGFGSALNSDSARRIGLIPSGINGEMLSVGNAAGAGAVALLMSGEARAAAAKSTDIFCYHELSESAFFMEQFVLQMEF